MSYEGKKVSVWRYLAVTGIFLCLILGMRIQAQAAKSMEIQSCQISSSDHSKVEVKASGATIMAGTDGNYYLVALLPYEKQVTKKSIVAGTKAQKSLVTYRVNLNLKSRSSILYRKFAIAVKKNNKYQIVSNFQYITNPESLAPVRKAFPKAASKKGLHIKPTMISDAEDLGIKHAAVNICLDTFIATSGQKNSSSAYPYTYQGRQYWFLKSGCNEVDRQTKELARSNVIVSGILLLRQYRGGKVLVPPNARNTGKNYYGINTMDQEGLETLEALMHFLGDRYMNSNGKYGTIVNWIVGNEVNNYNDYNYMGKLSFNEYIDAYTRSFRVVSMALRSVYSKARVYISLDHLWNILQPHGKCYTSKSTLDAFAKRLKQEGDINWNLAFHPYPSPLTDPNFWNDNVTNSDSTKQVTMKNLSYLTNYVSSHFRSDVRILLSEQGFTSVSYGTTNETLQAAAWAYAYYITEFNDKVDAFIMNRHVDHKQETSQGLYLGVWTNKKGNLEYADKKKQIWNVFKYIDSSGSKKVSQFALKSIGIKNWSSVIPGFSWKKFSSMGSYTSGKGIVFKTVAKSKNITNSVKNGYNATVKKSGRKTTVKVHTSINPNLYVGADWRFSKKLNFTSRKYFTCKLNITGMKEKYAHVRIRFFHGNSVYESSAKVKGGGTRAVSVNLSKWAYRGSVNKIQIWVRPYSKTRWKNGSKIVITEMKQAATAK